MPFTFAHPAAVVPLRNRLGRFGVLSALVIGSMTPDFSYFLPGAIPRSMSHSVLGLLWICLPIGLLGYVIFHVLLKGPLLALLPDNVLRRLGDHTSTYRSLPPVSWAAVVISSSIGAMTHLLWDAFTHDHAPGVVAFPALQWQLFSVGSYDVHVYELLQHVSTLAGLGLLAFWSGRWLAKAPPRPISLPIVLSAARQYGVLICIIGGAVAAGVWAGVRGVGASTGVFAFVDFITAAIFAAIPAAAFGVVVYSIAWHSLAGTVKRSKDVA